MTLSITSGCGISLKIVVMFFDVTSFSFFCLVFSFFAEKNVMFRSKVELQQNWKEKMFIMVLILLKHS